MSLLPTRRAALVAALGALALLAYPGVPLNVFAGAGVVTAMVLVVSLVDSLVGTSPRHIEVQRRHPPVVVAGRRVEIVWTVRSFARRGLRVELADHLAPSLRASARRFRVKIPPEATVTVAATLEPMRRGHFELDRVAVRVAGPLGMGARQREVPLRTELRVHPPFRSAKEAELRIRRARILEVGMRSARGLGGGTDFEQLREYGPDDEFRRGIEAETGIKPAWAAEAFTDPDEDIRQSIGRIRADGEAEIAVPVFDRDLEIARAGARIIPQSARIIIVEGNYLLLDAEPWRSLVFDTTVMIDADRDVPALQALLRDQQAAFNADSHSGRQFTERARIAYPRFQKGKLP